MRTGCILNCICSDPAFYRAGFTYLRAGLGAFLKRVLYVFFFLSPVQVRFQVSYTLKIHTWIGESNLTKIPFKNCNETVPRHMQLGFQDLLGSTYFRVSFLKHKQDSSWEDRMQRLHLEKELHELWIVFFFFKIICVTRSFPSHRDSTPLQQRKCSLHSLGSPGFTWIGHTLDQLIWMVGLQVFKTLQWGDSRARCSWPVGKPSTYY